VIVERESLSESAAALIALLMRRGPMTSAQLQRELGKSQPTVSRLLQSSAPRVLTLSRGKSARYALPQRILGLPAQQPLHWVHEDGRVQAWGELSLVQGGRVHVQAEGVDVLVAGGLPWFLSPLRVQGFLGRLLARRLAPFGLDGDPQRWSVEQILFAAHEVLDPPGALLFGERRPAPERMLIQANEVAQRFDELAATLAAGSSAAGEQAKFIVGLNDGHAKECIVKFSPPRGTPFGERWHDLLHAESLAAQTLSEHGVPVVTTRIRETAARTYLESVRFDRLPGSGRRHVVPLDAVHEAFVADARRNWAATCAALARQRRLPPDAPAQVSALMHFGHLIGNTDMHFGNLGLIVAPANVPRGRFTLAPVYDMLPMRWRPDPQAGSLDLLPFTPRDEALQSPALAVARVFWTRAAESTAISRGFRALAREMLLRLA
jgi:HipA-like C-terminal domain/Bacterial regulatory protein, arsR family